MNSVIQVVQKVDVAKVRYLNPRNAKYAFHAVCDEKIKFKYKKNIIQDSPNKSFKKISKIPRKKK